MNIETKRITTYDQDLAAALKEAEGFEMNAGFFENSQNVFLVAYDDGAPAGYLIAYLLERINSPQPKMMVYSVDTFPEFRRRGVGTALIEKVKEIAREKNCKSVFIPTHASNVCAMGLYEKTGGTRTAQDDVIFAYDL